nr:hypothetical protein [Tanacetum cinerariifolium]
DCCCSKGNVEDKILVPKPPKNYTRCARCGHPVDGPCCQGCALVRKILEEDLVTHFQDFQNTSKSSYDSTNVVNAPREPFVVKQDHGSFVDKIICDLNKAPDSPYLHTFSLNPFRCFHYKDVLGDGKVCQRCTCTRCGSGLSKGLCLICRNNQNSLNDSPISLQNPPHIDERCYECGDALDGIFCQRCTCFDQTKTPQFPVIHPPPQETSIEILHDQENEEISSGSTTTHSDISLSNYKAFSFYDDHIEEISSGSTTTHSDISLSEYDSFIFDLSNDQFPLTDRSDFTHAEFADELDHIISPPEYDCFYFRNFPDLGER